MLMRMFRKGALGAAALERQARVVATRLGVNLAVTRLVVEWCFYIEVARLLTDEESRRLDWLLSETFGAGDFGQRSFVEGMPTVVEVGPRPNFRTAFSTTAVDICRAAGLDAVTRLERSTRFGFSTRLGQAQAEDFLRPLHDRMTEMRYREPPQTLQLLVKPAAVSSIDVCGLRGRAYLEAYNQRIGCGWDEDDLAFILRLFRESVRRNPTDVELFMIAQANSEHSRHHRFRGRHEIDGIEMSLSLMDMIQRPWREHSANSTLAFSDDASAIQGGLVRLFEPSDPTGPSSFVIRAFLLHLTHKAETHNHPSWIEPYNGAATGSGGEFRDRMSVGRGGKLGMSGAGYMVGALRIPGYDMPWEQAAYPHPSIGASPLEILIRASDGVSGYGNCFGDPVTYGTTRSAAITAPGGRHFAYHKPVVYVCGAGILRHDHLKKRHPEAGMLIVHLGGSGYRIGLGGGAASSMLGGTNDAELDFASVQRAAPEMEQRVNRLIRACVELGERNPFVSVHDLGAGGLSNAVPELVHPTGGRIRVQNIPCGDASLSTVELFGNESQEREVVLIRAESLPLLEAIARREGVPLSVLGEVTGDGRIMLEDRDGSCPVDLPLRELLEDLPTKSYTDSRQPFHGWSLALPSGLTVFGALRRVLRLPDVGSKGFLVHKVDRSVGGLIAQQQCVGPSQLPVADCAILADSYLARSAAVHSIGERSIVGILSPEATARLAVAEALLNMSGAVIPSLDMVKLAANWMLAVKLPGRGAWLYDAVDALTQFCVELGIAIDGGKDSLSMAVKVLIESLGKTVTVEAPPTLIIEAYAPMPELACKVTPDLKRPGNRLVWVSASPGKYRLGGSALARVFEQLGQEPPDVDDAALLARIFASVQTLVREGRIVSLHDVSDGGLVTTLLEMAFAGNLGLDVTCRAEASAFETLFSEEPGVVIECEDADAILAYFAEQGIMAQRLGSITVAPHITIRHGLAVALSETLTSLRALWSETSDQLERLQSNPVCATSARRTVRSLLAPPWRLAFTPTPIEPGLLARTSGKPRVAIIRAEGSNGDREMAFAFHLAGFNPCDVTMSDLLEGRITLDEFRGIAFVGGFSFADVFDSAKGWAGMIRFNARLRDEFERFRARSDTFSFGVCNGCQLMALLGWVPGLDLPMEQQPRFVHNESGRFESRLSSLRIEPGPAIMLQGMAGSILGCIVAHGEGRLHVPSADVMSSIKKRRLVPARYVDMYGKPTQVYPFNPNGSADAAAGLCSPDGRHLALMPHPERLALNWQWPWQPSEWKQLPASPWLQLFQNAYRWCCP